MVPRLAPCGPRGVLVNGPEFVAVAVKGWISGVGAKTAYTEPGSPWENGYVESFNCKLRNDHDVAGLEAREQTMQLGLLVAMLHAGPLFHDLLASRLGQRAALRGGRTLVSGTVPKVANQHGAMPSDEPWFTWEALSAEASAPGGPSCVEDAGRSCGSLSRVMAGPAFEGLMSLRSVHPRNSRRL
jgi:hypothetical protein